MQVLSTHPSDHRGTNALKRALADIDAPNWCVVYGDRRDMCEAVLAARYEGKRVIHVGGGETEHFDHKLRHPDHWTRDAISMLASVHCVANEHARRNLMTIGIVNDVHITGCPSLDEVVEFAKTPRTRTGGRFEWLPESPGAFKPIVAERLSEAEFLERMATCSEFITNSSAGLREAPILGTPVVMVGDRQAGRAPAGTYHHPQGKACEEIARIIRSVI